MKKKIKLRDLTPEQYSKYKDGGCGRNGSCNECVFRSVNCVRANKSSWVYHKDLYSDKFLDQEIEIEVPTFTDKEREYLHNLLEPFKDRIKEIKLVGLHNCSLAYLQISIKSVISHYDTANIDFINLPYFETGTMYKNLKVNKPYTDDELKELLKELELL